MPKHSSETFVTNQISSLVDASPATLDTLNELAAALGDDANFASTVTTSLASKADASHTHTSADVTDFETAVDTAGAVMESDYLTANGRRYRLYNPYARGGSVQLKGQLHAHSTGSFDAGGSNSPTQVVTAYKTASYDFISITDHNALTTDPGVTGITFIPGIEEFGAPEALTKGHILAFNTTTNSANDQNQLVINDHKNAGDLVMLAHPNMRPYNLSELELLSLERYDLIEIYNPSINADYYNAEDRWDMLLSYGKRVFGTAVDDSHDSGGGTLNNGWVTVNAAANTLANIVTELSAGNFYASNGASMAVTVSGATVSVTTPSSSTIEFIGKYGTVLKTVSASTSGSYDITGQEMYVRVRVTKTSDSTMAWSQPIFLGDEATTDMVRSVVSGQIGEHYRNALTNGNMEVWQRNTTFSAAGYTADRWKVLATNVTTFAVTRQDTQDEYGRAAMRLQLTTKGVGTPDLVAIQPLETNDSYAFRGKTVTFSLLVRRNSTFNAGNMRINIYQGTGTDEPTVSTGRIDSYKDIAYSELKTTKWTRVYVTAFVRSDTTQLGVMFRLNDANVPNGSYIEVRQCQLHVGSYPLLYQPRTLHEELLRCFRYYYKWDNTQATGAHYSHPSSVSTASVVKWYFKFPVYMRAAVAPTITGTRGTDWTIDNATAATNTNAATLGTEVGTRDYGLVRFESGTFTAGTIYSLKLVSGQSGSIQWDAELN